MFLFFAAALVVQVVCWAALAAGFGRATAGDVPDPPADPAPTSVIVAARDEAHRIGPLLDALAAQTHADFEAVIVDDGSTDETAALVQARAAADPRFRLVRVNEAADPSMPRKKRALATGIAAARHDRLAFTDADCIPPADWLATLAAHAEAAPEAVLVGYGPYAVRPGLLNALVRYETFMTAVLTAGAVGLGRPYMAVGRNLSYPKALFERVGGFDHQRQSLSGDDDLLVQEAHRHGIPVRYVAGAPVPSEAPGSWRQGLHQKRRHASAGAHYDRGTQGALAVLHLSSLAVWAAPLALGWTGAALLAGRFLVQRAVLRRAAEALHPEAGVMAAQPALDLLYTLYVAVGAPLAGALGAQRW